jgi:hypothetical protein
MNDIKAWQGDTIPLTATSPDETATSATLLIGAVGEEAVFTKTENFTDGIVDLTITDEENIEANIPVGEHKYMIQIVYSDGSELTFPQPDSCDLSELPNFVIQERIE